MLDTKKKINNTRNGVLEWSLVVLDDSGDLHPRN